MIKKPSFSSVIQTKGFQVLWANQILVQLAYNILNFSLIIWVFKLTDSNLAVSLLILSIYLPALIFGLFAGVFVDLVDKRKIITLIDLLFVVAFLIFPFIRKSYPLILVNTFFINSLAQFFMPAESSSIPQLVSQKQLFLANSLFTVTLYAAFMVGFTAAGPILDSFSISPIFYLGAILLLMAALISQNLPVLKVVRKDNFSGADIWSLIASETKQTITFIRGRLAIVVSIGLLAALQGVIGVLAVLTPSYMERVLGVHATDASLYVMLPLGLGLISGALFIGHFFHRLPRRRLVIPGIILAGFLLAGVGIAPKIAVLLDATTLPQKIIHLRYFLNAPSLASTFVIGAFLLGVAAIAIIIPSQTVLQENTKDENRGKIFAVLFVLMNAFAILPVLLAGILADLFGETKVFFAMGVVIFMTGLLAMKPAMFFAESHLPYKVRQFLGLGHWENGK
ncbi:MFS transporter [Candidatus Daviesbacteria bacterium]|nr:MFS transporter [Candidatus Daviesbacteria bacterium]